MPTPLSYIEALLLEQIAEGNVEVNENSFPATIYVNERIADDSVMPVIVNLDRKGCLRRQNLTAGHYVFTISERGTEYLQQTLMRRRNTEDD